MFELEHFPFATFVDVDASLSSFSRLQEDRKVDGEEDPNDFLSKRTRKAVTNEQRGQWPGVG